MTGWAILAALLVIVAIVSYEVRAAIKTTEMWVRFERDENEDGGA